jgi:hypothetical protein
MGVAKASLEASTRYLAYDLGPQKIRVNCISAGPVNTLAARGIAGFNEMFKHYEAHAPLKRNLVPEELGATGLFLASDGAGAITGQVITIAAIKSRHVVGLQPHAARGRHLVTSRKPALGFIFVTLFLDILGINDHPHPAEAHRGVLWCDVSRCPCSAGLPQFIL